MKVKELIVLLLEQDPEAVAVIELENKCIAIMGVYYDDRYTNTYIVPRSTLTILEEKKK